MGERDGYAPGTFCWTDLTSTDPEGAKAFYTGLFGWQAEDIPVGEGYVYTMMRRDGRDVAAVSAQPEAQREMGVPSLWNSYIWVASADETAARAAELGAHVHAPPFDVMGAGRMAVLRDPQGAHVLLWEPRDHRGAGLVNAHGALAWNELNTPDIEGSRTFYGSLFGWSSSQFENNPDPYFVVQVDGHPNGGIRPLESPEMPPNWTVYFGIDDIDQGIARVGELGGRMIAGPIDIGVARIAVATDPSGAVFALYDGEMQP